MKGYAYHNYIVLGDNYRLVKYLSWRSDKFLYIFILRKKIFFYYFYFYIQQISNQYDYEIFGEVHKEYECVICHYLMKEAVGLPCDHAFCKLCLQQWEREQSANKYV